MPAKRNAASSAAPTASSPSVQSTSTAPLTSTTNPMTSTTSPSATTKSLSSGPSTLKANSSPVEIAQHVWRQYLATTPQRTLLLDAFMAFLVLVGGVQFVYCVVAGNYPFNAFLSGFSAAVGQFVLTASLRMQTNTTTTTVESNVAKGAKIGGPKGKNVKIATAAAAAGAEDGQEQSVSKVSDERAFADFLFGSLILHFFCINFIN